MAALIGLDSTSSGFDPGLQNPPITFGVWGDSGDADGVIGSSNAGVGVFGRSIDAAGTAVKGSSESGTGVEATTAGGRAVHARRDPGGGAAVTEAFLATPSLAADFRGDVATSGAFRVGGRLGIGTGAQTGPAAQLHVNGAEEGIRVQGRATGNANVAYVSFVDSAGTRIGYVGDGSTWDANVFLTSDLGDVVLETAAGRSVTATSTGNVGIGTGTPSAKLNIDPKGPGGIVVGDPDTGSGGFTSLLMDISDARDGFGRIQAIKSSGSAWGDIALNPLGGNVGIGPGPRLAVDGQSGVVTIFGQLKVTGGKNCLVDSPCDPENKTLTHACVESDERFNVYSGNTVLDENGEARVMLPQWVAAFNRDFRYQLTCIGQAAPVYVAQEVFDDAFSIAGGAAGMKVSWQLTGVRNDAWAQANPLVVEQEKPDDEKGFLLNPEVFGQSSPANTTQPKYQRSEHFIRAYPRQAEQMMRTGDQRTCALTSAPNEIV